MTALDSVAPVAKLQPCKTTYLPMKLTYTLTVSWRWLKTPGLITLGSVAPVANLQPCRTTYLPMKLTYTLTVWWRWLKTPGLITPGSDAPVAKLQPCRTTYLPMVSSTAPTCMSHGCTGMPAVVVTLCRSRRVTSGSSGPPDVSVTSNAFVSSDIVSVACLALSPPPTVSPLLLLDSGSF